MRALARPAARAPAVIAFLLCSIVAHLVALRGASVSGWLAPPPRESAQVTVELIVPAPPAAAPPVASAAAPARPKPAPRARPRATPRAVPAPAEAAAAAPVVMAPAASFADSDPFGAMLDLADGDALPAGATDAAAQDDAAATTGSPTGASPGAATPAQRADEQGVAVAAAAAATTPAALLAEAPIVVTPQSGTVHYRVHYGDPLDGNVVATLEQSFEIGPQHYRLHSEGRAQGLVSWFYRGSLVQDSVGTVSAAGLAPSNYHERRGDRPPRSATIDTVQGEVIFGSGRRREAPQGVQDRLSVVVQLALLRQSRPAQFEPGATIRLSMLGNSSVEPVDWSVIGEETVNTDAGAVRALRLNRPGAGDDPAIDVWLALDERIVPVRMRVTERSGRALDQVLASQ